MSDATLYHVIRWSVGFPGECAYTKRCQCGASDISGGVVNGWTCSPDSGHMSHEKRTPLYQSGHATIP
jgi:hypothetical protein